ncbi:MAG: aminotransferase class III-fold pyridoxal phosphate-dependent enzyme, partial [Oscillospiraceae bacterium]|nr:aminotransferase class III-fold pyridoxal phosphate-dependent enzyme [Oscillospiraceae bacterium]
DGISLAKGLGGGLPLGAVVLSEKLAAGMGKGTHGSTYGGNPVVCAGANVVLDTLTDSFLAEVQRKAALLREKLAALPHVQEVSGLGLMVGIQFEEGVSAGDVLAECRENGLLVLTAKTRLRLLPPLVLTEEDIEKAVSVLEKVLKSF